MKSDTPRTDRYVRAFQHNALKSDSEDPTTEFVYAEAARSIERDLNEARLELENTRHELAILRLFDTDKDEAGCEIARLQTELARVTVERDKGAGKCTPEHTWKQWTDELRAELARLGNELYQHRSSSEQYAKEHADAAEIIADLRRDKSRLDFILKNFGVSRWCERRQKIVTIHDRSEVDTELSEGAS